MVPIEWEQYPNLKGPVSPHLSGSEAFAYSCLYPRITMPKRCDYPLSRPMKPSSAGRVYPGLLQTPKILCHFGMNLKHPIASSIDTSDADESL